MNILILGLNNNSDFLIKSLKNHFIIGIDKNKNAKNVKYCDIFIETSITDKKYIIKKLENLKIKPNLIMTNSFTFGNETLAYLNDYFKLPGLKKKQYNLLKDKLYIKNLLKKYSVLIPEDYPIKRKTIKKLRYGDGLEVITDLNSDKEYFTEVFLEGISVSFRILIFKGKIHIIDMSKKIHSIDKIKHTGEIFGFHFPKYKEYVENITRIIYSKLENDFFPYLKLDFIEKNGKLYFLEAEYQFIQRDYYILSKIYNTNFFYLPVQLLETHFKFTRKKRLKLGAYILSKNKIFYIFKN